MSFVPEGPALPLLGLEGPRRQSRLSIGFRIILAIPHLIYAALLGIVLFFAVIAAWFGALALGRLPDGLATFIGRVLQYVTRVQAYGELLLTDRYPPFALDADDKAFVMDELRAPLDIDSVAQAARSPEEAAEIYTVSLLAIDIDSPAERGYLALLAARLKLEDALVAHLHTSVEGATEPASQQA